MYWQGVLVREPRVCIRSRGSVFLVLRPSTRPNEKPHSQSHGSLGTPRRHEPRPPLARPGQCAASARTASSGFTLRWFTEGFDTRDLKEAKALLEELAS